jgi:hypothetical protein
MSSKFEQSDGKLRMSFKRYYVDDMPQIVSHDTAIKLKRASVTDIQKNASSYTGLYLYFLRRFKKINVFLGALDILIEISSLRDAITELKTLKYKDVVKICIDKETNFLIASILSLVCIHVFQCLLHLSITLDL